MTRPAIEDLQHSSPRACHQLNSKALRYGHYRARSVKLAEAEPFSA